MHSLKSACDTSKTLSRSVCSKFGVWEENKPRSGKQFENYFLLTLLLKLKYFESEIVNLPFFILRQNKVKLIEALSEVQ